MGMTIDEAIYHLQELADSKFEQMGRYDRASGYAISHNEDIRTADAKRLEQRAKECIQLAKWLKDYKRLLSAIEEIKAEITEPNEMDRLENSNLWQGWFLKLINKHTSGKNKDKDKDEAKAVCYDSDGYADGAMVYDYAYCPKCNHEFEEDSENWGCEFCPSCGQRLRWEE